MLAAARCVHHLPGDFARVDLFQIEPRQFVGVGQYSTQGHRFNQTASHTGHHHGRCISQQGLGLGWIDPLVLDHQLQNWMCQALASFGQALWMRGQDCVGV